MWFLDTKMKIDMVRKAANKMKPTKKHKPMTLVLIDLDFWYKRFRNNNILLASFSRHLIALVIS